LCCVSGLAPTPLVDFTLFFFADTVAFGAHASPGRDQSVRVAEKLRFIPGR